MELDKRGAEMLFQVLTEREERNSIAIASNEPFSGWTKTFTDPRLCAAIVDRLTFGGNIIETGQSPTGSLTLGRNAPPPGIDRYSHPYLGGDPASPAVLGVGSRAIRLVAGVGHLLPMPKIRA